MKKDESLLDKEFKKDPDTIIYCVAEIAKLPMEDNKVEFKDVAFLIKDLLKTVPIRQQLKILKKIKRKGKKWEFLKK